MEDGEAQDEASSDVNIIDTPNEFMKWFMDLEEDLNEESALQSRYFPTMCDN